MKSFQIAISALVVGISALLQQVNAQNWEYRQHVSASHAAEIRGLTLDSEENLYVTTFHKNDGTLEGPHGTKLYPTAGNQDILLLKLDQDGDTLWTRSVFGVHSDYPRQVEVDDADNPYLTGIYRRSELTIQDELLPLPSDNSYDVFLSQYTKTGGNVFAKRVAWGPLDDQVDKIALDASNNIYMVGTYYDTLYFEGDTLTTPTELDKYLFIAKFSPEGDFLWADSIPLISTTNTGSFLDIVVNNYQEIYLSGFFRGEIRYGDSSRTSNGDADDIILAKIDSSGTLQWMRRAGSKDYSDRANGLTTDVNGAVYITGYFSDTAYFDGIQKVSAGGTDMFMAKYNNSGSAIWVSRNGDVGTDIAYGAKIRENLLQATGGFSGTVTFNNTVLTSNSIADQNIGFFVYDIDGNPITAMDVPANAVDALDRGEYIEYDTKGNTYVGGVFRTDALYVGNDTIYKAAASGGDPREAFVVKYSNPFSATFSTIQNVSCNDSSDGKLVVTSYFGTAPYTYQWSPNISVFDDSAAFDLPGGDYWVKITDVDGDTVTIFQSLTEPDPFILTVDSTNITCNGDENGTLSASATGGTGTLTYAWTGGNAVPGDIPNQTNLVPGQYNLTILDEVGCPAYDSVNLTEPSKITFGPITMVIESPIFSYTGKIFLDVKGGVAPYTYSWDSVGGTYVGEITDSLVNRTEGYYTARVQDANLCIVDTVINLLGESFRAQVFKTDITCYDSSNGWGYAQVVSGGDNPPFTYTWTDSIGTDITPAIDTAVYDLSPGWYYCTAEDALSTIHIDSFLITEPDSIEILLDPDSVNCYGESTGFILLSKTGGTTPFNYLWSNSATTQSISSIAAGWYNVMVTDANGCFVDDSIEVEQNNELLLSISEITSVSCNGYLDGRLQANVSGGALPYSYLWDDPQPQTASRATNLAARNYTVIVTDNVGCTNNESYDLTEPEMLSIANVDSSNVTCYNSLDGRIAVTMIGGTQPFTYNWPYALPDTNVVEGLFPAIYNLVVTDSKDCINDNLTVVISRPAIALNLSEVLDSHIDNDCYGGAEGSMTVNAIGGWSSGYSYSLDTLNWQAGPTFASLVAGDYEVFVLDANNCLESADIEILEESQIVINTEEVFGSTILVSASGGAAPLTYSLDGSGTPQTSGRFDDLSNGTYYVAVNDANDCGPVNSGNLTVNIVSVTETFEDIISIYPNPSNGLINIELIAETDSEFKFELYSMTGKRVHEELFDAASNGKIKRELNIMGLKSGVYLIKINGIALDSKLIVE